MLRVLRWPRFFSDLRLQRRRVKPSDDHCSPKNASIVDHSGIRCNLKCRNMQVRTALPKEADCAETKEVCRQKLGLVARHHLHTDQGGRRVWNVHRISRRTYGRPVSGDCSKWGLGNVVWGKTIICGRHQIIGHNYPTGLQQQNARGLVPSPNVDWCGGHTYCTRPYHITTHYYTLSLGRAHSVWHTDSHHVSPWRGGQRIMDKRFAKLLASDRRLFVTVPRDYLCGQYSRVGSF
jgi:hypothetical protein